jgi:TRAP-type mannitol/chloroaromatic compound transport system substrate-binding protein
MIELAAQLNTFMTFGQYGEADLAAWDKLKAGDNTFVALDQSFIDAAREASLAWAEKQAAENAWFKRAYESQKALQEKLGTWDEFRRPIGASANR